MSPGPGSPRPVSGQEAWPSRAPGVGRGGPGQGPCLSYRSCEATRLCVEAIHRSLSRKRFQGLSSRRSCYWWARTQGTDTPHGKGQMDTGGFLPCVDSLLNITDAPPRVHSIFSRGTGTSPLAQLLLRLLGLPCRSVGRLPSRLPARGWGLASHFSWWKPDFSAFLNGLTCVHLRLQWWLSP